MSIKVTVVVQKEENWYVAKCIENSVASQGKTIEESLVNLREALELYYEDTPHDTDTVPTFITTVEVAI
ncbi:type II toxin-antitoxin system HicB family antitoxin [Anoxynatronum buryatiense]|uniref:Predicted nuclease of the RNAse H fold, HicB family n=1 Tax=Anoxynatronum buryatiense TaxID=489973 RepID=A0AA45WYW4_9CLOT|nr:type II toxin-antitoxin system HicB family antitoxin [Anoxynatronum buryatiense]SMP70874.1 Predicted nuclease of the RNAse H fold, HicB family [Anoxynatronum buryatiense]